MNRAQLTDTALDGAIRNAHDKGDLVALVDLYCEGSGRKAAGGDADASLFLLTQAYVMALDTGDMRAAAIHAQLVAAGREA